MKFKLLPWFGLLCISALAHAGSDAQYQIHGFAAQGLAWSDGNNAYGESTDGSLKYYELGLNGRWSASDWLSLSAQGLARRAGASDDGHARLDFAFLDLQPIRQLDWQAGARLGRVKNPHGFYNETRDVAFTRPSIALPNSIYADGQGLRGYMFSVAGAQLYSQHTHGEHFSSVLVNLAPDYEVDEQDDRALLGRFARFSDAGDFQVRDFLRAQLLNEWFSGRWRTALSYFSGQLDFDSRNGKFRAEQQINLGIVSVGYRAQRFAVTAEYQRTWTDILFVSSNTRIDTQVVSDGAYIQADWLIDPRWTAFIRADSRFNDAKDRDGRGSNDRYRQFAHDLVLGGHWQPSRHWGVWGEVHQTYGTANVPQQDNEGRTLDPHWTLVLLMAGYRF